MASHFHSPAHSPRFLLGLFILTIPTLLASLLAFLVDILLFIPHVGWGGWIVLAATIIVIIASLVTCGMRRTLVSRKARRKRIAENAEMSGENYFNNKRSAEVGVIDATLPRAESPPPLTGGSMSPEFGNATKFGTSFDLKPTQSLDDRTPLNPSNNPSLRNGNMGGMGYADPGQGPSRGPDGSPPRDQYGNILPPAIGGRRNSNGSLGSNRSNGQQMYARGGRGGYPPPNRGGYPPRGGPMMRGGPSNMRGGPPPGWNGRGRGMGPPGPGMLPGGAMMGRGGPPPPGYQQERYFAGGPGGPPGPGSRDQSPAPYTGGPPRMQMDGIGQAVELDERNGLPSPTMPQE